MLFWKIVPFVILQPTVSRLPNMFISLTIWPKFTIQEVFGQPKVVYPRSQLNVNRSVDKDDLGKSILKQFFWIRHFHNCTRESLKHKLCLMAHLISWKVWYQEDQANALQFNAIPRHLQACKHLLECSHVVTLCCKEQKDWQYVTFVTCFLLWYTVWDTKCI